MINTDKLSAAIRTRRGNMSLREAAKESGINRGTLSEVERGAKPGLDTFLRLCQWVGVETDYFVDPERQPATA